MAFAIPKKLKSRNLLVAKDVSLKEFSNGDVINISVLGRGSFGTAWKVKYNDELAVVKIMDLRDKKEEAQKFLKEARVLNSLKENENIVTFKGVNYQPPSIMLEFCCFDFKPLGGDQEIPSLDQFLDYVDRFQFKNLKLFSIKIAKDITHGLSFLHSKGIARKCFSDKSSLHRLKRQMPGKKHGSEANHM